VRKTQRRQRVSHRRYAQPAADRTGKPDLSLIRDVSNREPGTGLRFHLAALVDSSGDAIVGETMEGVSTSWNRRAERIFGYSAKEAIGKPISMLLPPAGSDEELNSLGSLKRGETINAYDAVRMRKDGRNVEVSITMSPIFDPLGNLVGASKVARDISDARCWKRSWKCAGRRRWRRLAFRHWA